MNRLLLLLSISILSLFCSCETDEDFIDLSFENEQEDTIIWDNNIGVRISKFMSNSAGGSVQGADCYGDYLFQFQDHNAAVYIYNLAKKKLIETIELEPISMNHCNNVSFSNVFYDIYDEFPLLYVSGSRSRSYNNVQVYRIIRDNDKLSIVQVQEIVLPKSSPENHMYWTDVMIDTGHMYVSSAAYGGGGKITVFNIPPLDDMLFPMSDDDIVDSFDVDKFTHHQGANIYNNFMYVFDGVPAWGDTNFLRIIDLERKMDAITLNVMDKGLKAEPEGTFFYKGELYCATNNAGIFKVSLFYR